MKLTGYKAIEYAEANSLTLSKYTDPVEEAREGLTVDEARKIAREDPSLIYVEISDFTPTHVITMQNGERIEVRLVDGAAYTRAEWDANEPADYERQDNGDWTFQGQPFAGTVKALGTKETK